jgi:signal transduction histidine kinase
VNNAVKHSGARSIDVVLDHDGRNLVLKIRDNGKGMDPMGQEKGMGLNIMRYRAKMLGGALELERTAGGGTTVVCAVPLPAQPGSTP